MCLEKPYRHHRCMCKMVRLRKPQHTTLRLYQAHRAYVLPLPAKLPDLNPIIVMSSVVCLGDEALLL